MNGLEELPKGAIDTLSGNLLGAAFIVLMGVIIWLLIRYDRRQKTHDEAIAVKDAKIDELYEQNRADATLLRDKLEAGLDKLAAASALQSEFLSVLNSKRPSR